MRSFLKSRGIQCVPRRIEGVKPPVIGGRFHNQGRIRRTAKSEFADCAAQFTNSDHRPAQVDRSDADEPVRICTDECSNLIIVYQWGTRSPQGAHEPETDTAGIHLQSSR
jgi:hypothetical protein